MPGTILLTVLAAHVLGDFSSRSSAKVLQTDVGAPSNNTRQLQSLQIDRSTTTVLQIAPTCFAPGL